MKRKAKHTKLYEFLERTNALSGTDEEIEAAIREYRKQYKTEWRRQKRKANQEITVALNAHEHHIIEAAAKKHHRSRAQYIKEAALAYCSKAFIVPDVLLLNSILESLVMTGAEIHRHFETGAVSYGTGKEMLKKIDRLEAEIQRCLRKPESLEDMIRNALKSNPAYRETILGLIKNSDK